MQVRVDRIKLGITNCYLIRHDAIALIDCGEVGRGEAFEQAVRALGVTPDEISLIVLTHGHFDHIGSTSDIARRTKAKVAIHRDDAHWLAQGLAAPARPATLWGRILLMALSAWPMSSKFRFPGVTPDIIVADEEVSLHGYGIPAKIIHTPGHTDGSISVVLENGEAIVGDMAMSGFPSLRGRPGLPIIAQDMEQLRASWRKVLRQGVNMIYPSHGEPFPAAVMAALVGFQKR